MKLILVDLDGTLFDTKEVNYQAYREAIEPYGYNIDYEYYCKYCNGKHFMDFLPQITTNDRVILNDMHQRKKLLYKKYLGYARINVHLVNMLKGCREEYKIALVTTASKQNTYDILDKFELSDVFDLVLTHEDVTKTKPDPEGYLKAMFAFGATSDETMIFEDSDVGIEAAQKTGAVVFVVKGYN